jgi:hypothetical protein
MVEFAFEVGHSFRDYPRHPITIPRGQVDYSQLEQEKLFGPIVIVAPSGERVPGKIYSSIAGFGKYHQICAVRADSDPLSGLVVGSQLRVEVARENNEVTATLQLA